MASRSTFVAAYSQNVAGGKGGNSRFKVDPTAMTPRVSLGKLFCFLKTLFTLQKDLTANISILAYAMDQYFGESCKKLRFRGDLLRFFDKFPAVFHVHRFEYDSYDSFKYVNQKWEPTKIHDAIVTWTPSESELNRRKRILVAMVQRFLESNTSPGTDEVMKILLGAAWKNGQSEALWEIMHPEEEIELMLEAVPCRPLDEQAEDNNSVGPEEAGYTTPSALTPRTEPIQPGYTFVHDPYSMKTSPDRDEAFVGQLKVFYTSSGSACSDNARVRFRTLEPFNAVVMSPSLGLV